MTDEPRTPRRRGKDLLLLLAILAVTVAVYVPSLSNEFVYDDHRFVPDNAGIKKLSPAQVVRFFTDLRTMTDTLGAPGWNDIYRPLRTLSYAVDWQIFGDRPVWYRLENLALHLLAVFLAWSLLRRILGRADLAAIGAAVFALHPLQTQSVAWISSRGDILAAVFVLGASLCLLHRDDPAPWRRDSLVSLRAVAGVLLYALALFSKESAIAFLAVVPLFDLGFGRRKRFRPLLLGSLVLVTASFLVLRFSLATGQLPFQFPDTLYGAGSATMVMLGHVLFPVRLLPYTGDVLFGPIRMNVPVGGVLLFLFASLGVLAVVFLVLRRQRLLCFGLLWAAVCLAPVSSIVPLKSVAESRFAYLPLVGVGPLVAVLVRRTGRTGAIGALGLIALMAGLTLKEARTWRTDLSLWLSGVAKEEDYRAPKPGREHRGGDVALANCGIAVARTTGDHAKALRYFYEAVEIRPSPETLTHIADATARLGRLEESFEAARRAYEMLPDEVPTREAWGRSLYQAGRSDLALPILHKALRIKPNFMPVRGWIGSCLLDLGDFDAAVDQLRACHRQAPRDNWVMVQYAIALLSVRDLDGAAEILDRLHRVDPAHGPAFAVRTGLRLLRGDEVPEEEVGAMVHAIDDMEAGGDPMRVVLLLRAIWPVEILSLQLKLVGTLIRRERLDEAENRLVQLRTSHPDELDVMANLGLVRLRMNRAREALPLLRQVAKRDPESFVICFALARACRETGKIEEAEARGRQAFSLASDPKQQADARAFVESLRR